MAASKKCRCGFAVGDRVKMKSSIRTTDGQSIGWVFGEVKPWGAGCGHIVEWEDMPTVTALPNPNVQRMGDES